MDIGILKCTVCIEKWVIDILKCTDYIEESVCLIKSGYIIKNV